MTAREEVETLVNNAIAILEDFIHEYEEDPGYSYQSADELIRIASDLRSRASDRYEEKEKKIGKGEA